MKRGCDWTGAVGWLSVVLGGSDGYSGCVGAGPWMLLMPSACSVIRKPGLRNP